MGQLNSTLRIPLSQTSKTKPPDVESQQETQESESQKRALPALPPVAENKQHPKRPRPSSLNNLALTIFTHSIPNRRESHALLQIIQKIRAKPQRVEELIPHLRRLPPELLRQMLELIYINICDEDYQTFGSARCLCDDFSDNALRDYGPYVGLVWSETFRTLPEAKARMDKLMERAPKYPALEAKLDCILDARNGYYTSWVGEE